MPAGKKVRTGCARCKKKRLKCDETQPSCQRCTRLNQTCPGYNLSLRWSTKHEVSKSESSSRGRRQRTRVDAQPSSVQSQSSHVYAASTELQPPLAGADPEFAILMGYDTPIQSTTPAHCSIAQDAILSQGLSGNNIMQDNATAFDFQDDEFTAFVDLDGDPLGPALSAIENHSAIFERNQQDLSHPTSLVSNSPRPPVSRNSTTLRQFHSTIWPVIVRSEDVLVEYYFKEVAIIYSCYDGYMNPFRSIIASLWTTSELVVKTLKSMAAACLAPEYPHLSLEGSKLRNEVFADLEKTSAVDQPVDVTLLVAIMLGQTAGWHDPQDLGLACYYRSKTLLAQLKSNSTGSIGTLLGRNISFFQIAIEYWEMLFAFVSKKQEVPESAVNVHQGPLSLLLVEPHPWALVLPGMLQIIRRIGELVWENRSSSQRRRFWHSSDLSVFRKAIDFSSELERQLLAYNLPSEDNIMDPLDDTTPVAHLLIICQAYRLVALIQIYRVFPDVLIARLQSQERREALVKCASNGSHQALLAGQNEHTMLGELAMHTLELVKSIPLESHTRCVQPFLLIALSSELGPIDRSPSKRATLSTIQARRFIRGRLESFRLLLPPKPAQCRLDLVLQIWNDTDTVGENVYWLDVVIEKEWRFLFG